MANITVGQRFGRLEVLGFSHRDSKRFPFWNVKCDCGAELAVNGYNLAANRSKSCGCLQKDVVRERSLRHAMSRHPAYTAWQRLRSRCNNPDDKDYELYGARGIRVAVEWRTFEKFWEDMGPSWVLGLEIDRIDNDGDYNAKNCRWATRREQVRNRRGVLAIDTPWGRMDIATAAEKSGIPHHLLYQRVRNGFPPERLFVPKLRNCGRPKLMKGLTQNDRSD